MVVLEIVVLVALVASLGGVARIWLGGWGILLAGVVVLGMIVPAVLELSPRRPGRLTVPTAAVLVLVAGFLLRMVIVLSSEGA